MYYAEMDESRKRVIGDYGRNSGCPEALSIGNYEAVSDPAFDHRGCRDLCRADHAAD